MWGSEFKELGAPPRRHARIEAQAGSLRKLARNANVAQIREQVTQAIANLPRAQQAQIPATATLPEMMVAYVLLRRSYNFQAQNAQSGGRLRLGGAVIDFMVFLGSRKIILRVHGDYWHSLPERVQKDAVQLLRLRAQGYGVGDLWEGDLYRAWMENRIEAVVEDAITTAV
jgi:G:T-mismatch repair DNA endonuclease (very short patch repair protein)